MSFPGNNTRRLWRAQDGLPDQTMQAIAQTPDGYLWISTKGGLLRFDGARLIVYDHTNTPGLQEQHQLSDGLAGRQFVDRNGGGGLVRYRDSVFRTYGSSDSFVRAI